MVEVRLHGALAAEFGRVWHLDIQTPREAVSAIECARKGFRAAIAALDQAGMVFRVRSKTHDYDNDDVGMTLGDTKRIDIIPIVRGASAGVRFVIGAVLTVIGIMTLQPTLIKAGAVLMLGAVVEALTPVQKRPEQKNLQNWGISGPVNTVDQGLPVPVIYGEVLAGGYTISAGVTAAQLNPGGTLGPAVAIGGRVNYEIYTGAGGTYTVVVMLSASPFNMDEPYTFTWTKSGFAGATAQRMIGANLSTLRLELDYSIGGAAYTSDTGTVSLAVSGKASAGVEGAGGTVNANNSQLVTIGISSYDGTGGQ